MGFSDTDFPRLVTDIVGRHAPDLDASQVRIQTSRQGRYQSVTVTIHAHSREQLDAIYRDLSAEERVVMAL